MSERKPTDESWEGFTEKLIRAAQEAGEFLNLPGFGKPIPGIDDPLDEHWWVKQKLASEQASVLPPLLEARLDLDRTRDRMDHVADEQLVRQHFLSLRERIQQAIFSPAANPSVAVPPIDVDGELNRWRERRQQRS